MNPQVLAETSWLVVAVLAAIGFVFFSIGMHFSRVPPEEDSWGQKRYTNFIVTGVMLLFFALAIALSKWST